MRQSENKTLRLLPMMFFALVVQPSYGQLVKPADDEIGEKGVALIKQKIKEPFLTLLASSEFASPRDVARRITDAADALEKFKAAFKEDFEITAAPTSVMPPLPASLEPTPTPASIPTPEIKPVEVTPPPAITPTPAPAPAISTMPAPIEIKLAAPAAEVTPPPAVTPTPAPAPVTPTAPAPIEIKLAAPAAEGTPPPAMTPTPVSAPATPMPMPVSVPAAEVTPPPDMTPMMPVAGTTGGM